MEWCSYYRDTLDDPSCYHLCRLKLACAKTSRFTSFIMMLSFLRTKPSPTILLTVDVCYWTITDTIIHVHQVFLDLNHRQIQMCKVHTTKNISKSPPSQLLPSRMRALILICSRCCVLYTQEHNIINIHIEGNLHATMSTHGCTNLTCSVSLKNGVEPDT
jgi:hypothetical protein